MKKYEFYIATQNVDNINNRVQKCQDNGFEVAGEMLLYNPNCSSGKIYAKVPMKREITKNL